MEEEKKIASNMPPREQPRPALVLRPFPVGKCEHMLLDAVSGWCEWVGPWWPITVGYDVCVLDRCHIDHWPLSLDRWILWRWSLLPWWPVTLHHYQWRWSSLPYWCMPYAAWDDVHLYHLASITSSWYVIYILPPYWPYWFSCMY